MQSHEIDAVILAGGAGRRIGGDKPFVDLAGRPLLAHVSARIAPQVRMVALNAPQDARAADLGLICLPDAVADMGPLGGVLAALDWAETRGARAVATVAVDTPFLPDDLISRLSAHNMDGASVVMAETADGLHPTTAIWQVGLRGPLRQALAAGARKVRDFTSACGARAVRFEDTAAFFNINTPQDLAQARQRLAT